MSNARALSMNRSAGFQHGALADGRSAPSRGSALRCGSRPQFTSKVGGVCFPRNIDPCHIERRTFVAVLSVAATFGFGECPALIRNSDPDDVMNFFRLVLCLAGLAMYFLARQAFNAPPYGTEHVHASSPASSHRPEKAPPMSSTHAATPNGLQPSSAETTIRKPQ